MSQMGKRDTYCSL